MVHITNSITNLYEFPEVQKKRYDDLIGQFKYLYGFEPEYLVRAPGRVNLIGDHIDYSHFSVLPMAIEADVIMAVRKIPGSKVYISNTDETYSSHCFTIGPRGVDNIESTNPSWIDYFKSGFAVARKYLIEEGIVNESTAFQILVTGNVPAGGGLSSSAAFVVNATLATLCINGLKDIDNKKLVALSVTCEQLVGVNSGGMDQAASVYGKKGHALFISFKPIFRVEPQAFPIKSGSFVFLLAHSLVASHKSKTASTQYNLRVVEVTLAAQLLARKTSVEIDLDGNLDMGTLRGFAVAYKKSMIGDKKANLSELTIPDLESMVQLVDKHLSAGGYTVERVVNELGLTKVEFEDRFLAKFAVRFEKLMLHERAKHVYTEAIRVLQFYNVMKTAKGNDEHTIKILGSLMNASHLSAQTLFESSHPEVDKIISIARSAGSAGSRVTGAGWGGYTIHLVPSVNAQRVKSALIANFYSQKNGLPNDALIETSAGSGCAIIAGL